MLMGHYVCQYETKFDEICLNMVNLGSASMDFLIMNYQCLIYDRIYLLNAHIKAIFHTAYEYK